MKDGLLAITQNYHWKMWFLPSVFEFQCFKQLRKLQGFRKLRNNLRVCIHPPFPLSPKFFPLLEQLCKTLQEDNTLMDLPPSPNLRCEWRIDQRLMLLEALSQNIGAIIPSKLNSFATAPEVPNADIRSVFQSGSNELFTLLEVDRIMHNQLLNIGIPKLQ